MANRFNLTGKVVFNTKEAVTLPRSTSAPANPVAGDMYFNTTTNQVQIYKDGSWQDVTVGSVSLTGQTLVENGIIVGDASGNSTAVNTNTNGDIEASSTNGLVVKDGVLDNVNIASNAAIDRTKLANGTPDRVVVNNASGVMTDSTVTTTELGHLSGATSNIQTQLDSKLESADLADYLKKDGSVAMTGNLNLGQLTAGLFSSLTFSYSDGLSDYYDLVMSAPAVANYEIVKVSGNDAEYSAESQTTVGYLGVGTTSTQVAQEPANPDYTFYAIRTSDNAIFKLATTTIGSASLYPYPPNFDGSNTYHKIINLADPTAAQDAANKQYVDAQIASIPSVDLSPYFKKDGSVELTGDIVPDFAGTRAVGTYNKPMGVMWTSQIYFGPGNLTRGTVDATNTEIILKSLMPNGNVKLQPDGTGFIDASSAKMSNLLDPTDAQEAATKNYVDTALTEKLSLAGGSMTGDIVMAGNRVTSLGAPINPSDAARKIDIENALSGLDFQKDVDDVQIDNTLVPVATLGKRYVITDSANLNAGFGGITGVEDGDIVEYAASNEFLVVYDVSVQGSGALVWSKQDTSFFRWDGTTWSEFGGLSSLNAGIGLIKTGNVIDVNLGAGISQLPTDEVGLDLHSSSGLMLTEDGTTDSTGTNAQLSLKLDGTTLSKSVDGVKVAAGGITDTEINAAANIAVSKLASLTANRVVQTGAGGKLEASNVTSEDLVYLSGVTAPIQNQLNGKANVSLNNISNTAINTDLLTNGSLLYDLGSTTQGWKHVYANSYRNGAGSSQISNVFAAAPTDTLSASFDATFYIGAFIYHANIPQGYARIISGDSGGNFTIDKTITTSINFETVDIVLPAALESIDVSSSISSAPAVLESGNNTGSGATGDIILKTGIPNTASKRGNARVSASNVVIEVDNSTFVQSSDPNMYNSVRTDVKEYQLTANTSAFTPISLDLNLTQSICKSGEISYEVENLITGEVRAGTIKFASSVSNIGFSDVFVSSEAAMDTNIEFQMVVNSGIISIEYKNLFTNICDFKIFRNTMGGFKM